MAKRIWEIDLDGKNHKIELTQSYITDKIDIHVDEYKIELPKSKSPKLIDYGSKHNFSISGHPCQIIIAFDGASYSYQLLVDGQPIMKDAAESQQEKAAAQAEFDRLRSIVGAPFFTLLGVIAFWFNWNYSHNRGFYFQKVALISPLPIIFALYLLFFPGDMSKPSPKALIRALIVLIIAVSLGFANLYALSNGIY